MGSPGRGVGRPGFQAQRHPHGPSSLAFLSRFSKLTGGGFPANSRDTTLGEPRSVILKYARYCRPAAPRGVSAQRPRPVALWLCGGAVESLLKAGRRRVQSPGTLQAAPSAPRNTGRGGTPGNTTPRPGGAICASAGPGGRGGEACARAARNLGLNLLCTHASCPGCGWLRTTSVIARANGASRGGGAERGFGSLSARWQCGRPARRGPVRKGPARCGSRRGSVGSRCRTSPSPAAA